LSRRLLRARFHRRAENEKSDPAKQTGTDGKSSIRLQPCCT
jgi:hypothetical protein